MRLIPLAALCFATCLAAGQDAPSIAAHRFVTAPVIDGTVDDAGEWKDVPKVSGLLEASTGAKAPEDGEFWLGYDDQYIYFAARLADSQPSGIKAVEYRTNVSLDGDDFVELGLDTEGTLRDFAEFQMNAKGATSMELPGGRAAKREWLGDFTAKGRITDKGWEVEARIPWQVLPACKPGKRDLRFYVGRFHQRNLRFYEFPYVESGRINNCARWQQVEVPELDTVRTLKLLPYDYLGFSAGSDFIANSGLDLKTDLTDSIQFVGTVNPDFRNVENQILSIDFSRFERLAGESRPFFREGSEYLSSVLYASQRIQNVDTGFNFYGKLDPKTSFGLLDTTYFKNERENDLVGGFSHALDPNTYLGGAFTSLTKEGVNNDAYLLRFSKNIGPYGIFMRRSESRDSDQGVGLETNLNTWYFKDGFNWWANYRTVSPDFMPRLGFTPERNLKGWNTGFNYERAVPKGALQDYNFYVSALDYERYKGGSYRDSIGGGFNLGFRKGMGLYTSYNLSTFEGVKDTLWSAGLGFPRNDPYRNINLNYAWGNLAGQSYEDIGVSMAYRATQKLQLTMSSQFVRHFDYDKQIILGANYDLGEDRSISCKAVQRGEDINAYIALRRSGNAGTEYYLILGDPNARTFKTRLILKVAYPMQLTLGARGKRVAKAAPAAPQQKVTTPTTAAAVENKTEAAKEPVPSESKESSESPVPSQSDPSSGGAPPSRSAPVCTSAGIKS